MNKQIEFLVGDNAFHGISHLSQQRARERAKADDPSDVINAARLVKLSLENGANGFMFSVSKTTLSILEALGENNSLNLYPIIPYAYEYVHLATRYGGIPGLVRKKSGEFILSRNAFNVAPNLLGIIRAKPSAFLKTYLIYEITRIRSVAGKQSNLRSVLLHEVITDMALALNVEWLFKEYIKFFKNSETRPGFETRNFPYLVSKFGEWGLDASQITVCSAFNKIGFQMNPNQKDCEKALNDAKFREIIAMSILAAGYLNPSEAFSYLNKLPKISHVVVGVSKEKHAVETFRLLKGT